MLSDGRAIDDLIGRLINESVVENPEDEGHELYELSISEEMREM